MMKTFTNCILLSLVCMSVITACNNDENATGNSTYEYKIEIRDSVSGIRIDTFRVEKYTAPIGKKFKATAIFKSMSVPTYPSTFLAEGDVLYIFFQITGTANKINLCQKFGFAKDMDIKEVTYQNLYSRLDVIDSCRTYFNSFKNQLDVYTDGDGVYNADFFHSVYTGSRSLSIPTKNGKGYISFVIE